MIVSPTTTIDQRNRCTELQVGASCQTLLIDLCGGGGGDTGCRYHYCSRLLLPPPPRSNMSVRQSAQAPAFISSRYFSIGVNGIAYTL